MAKPVAKTVTTRIAWEEILNLGAGDTVVLSVTKNGATTIGLNHTFSAGEKFRGRVALEGKIG